MRKRLVRISRVTHMARPVALKHLLWAVVAGTLAFTAAASASPSIDYRCTPGGVHNCGGWYRGPVELTWIYNTGDSQPFDGDCFKWTTKTFTADTRATALSCEVWNPMNHVQTAGDGTTLHIDHTAPKITGPGLPRAPDYGGWFNHPVRFGFTAQDPTSGLSSCSKGTYSGPDGAGVGLSGSCRDVAGNVASGVFRINYDATPPPSPRASVLPGKHRVRLTWHSSQYLAEVVRLSKASGNKLLFRGGAGRFVDRRLRNGHRYRYRVTLIDQAGNRRGDQISAVPTSSRLLLPADGAHLSSPPELVWKSVKRASYYNAQLLYRGRKVLTRWPVHNRLQLTRRWRSLGGRHHLARGRYCWFVWPGFGPRHDRNYGHVLGSSCFHITG
jgi:hypothetical protein